MQYAPQESSWLDDVGNFFADVGAHIVNDVASFGNALLNHPGDVAQALGGLGLTLASSAGEGLGTVLDATGIGAIGGVPLQAVSATGIATGATLTGTAMASIIQHSASDDHVEPIQTNQNSGTSSQPPEPAPPSGAKPGWSSRPTNNGKGTVWQKPGAHRNADSVRIMDPGADPRYPNGYVRFYNDQNQPIRLDGKPGADPDTHIPINPRDPPATAASLGVWTEPHPADRLLYQLSPGVVAERAVYLWYRHHDVVDVPARHLHLVAGHHRVHLPRQTRKPPTLTRGRRFVRPVRIPRRHDVRVAVLVGSTRAEQVAQQPVRVGATPAVLRCLRDHCSDRRDVSAGSTAPKTPRS